MVLLKHNTSLPQGLGDLQDKLHQYFEIKETISNIYYLHLPAKFFGGDEEHKFDPQHGQLRETAILKLPAFVRRDRVDRKKEKENLSTGLTSHLRTPQTHHLRTPAKGDKTLPVSPRGLHH